MAAIANDRGPQLTGVIVALYITSILTGALRLYTHGVIIKRLFAEDYVAILALLLFTAYTTFSILAVSHGVGKHTIDVAPENRPIAIMYRWLSSLLYIAISLLTKWIVGLFLLRICPHKRWRQITIWTILGTVTVFSILYFFFDVFSCQPVQYEWTRYNPEPADGSCNATTFATVTTYIAAVLNIVADWVLPALPATLVWKSQIESRMKISIIALMCLGSTASIATIVRIPYADGILDNPDYLYTFTDLGIWSTVEIGVALTASNLATLKPLMRKLHIFDTMSRGSRNGSSNQRPAGTAERAPWRNTSDRANPHASGDNHVKSKGGSSAPEAWGGRWGRRGSMELELVDKNEVASSVSKLDIEMAHSDNEV